MNALIRLLYSVLIAVSVVVFVGVATSALYPGPKLPEPAIYGSKGPSDEQMQKDQQSWQDYENKRKEHQHNIAKVLVPVAVIVLAAGLWYMRRSEIIGEGIALGGVGSSIYAVVSSSMGDDRVLRLAAVTTLLVGAILIVRQRFAEPTVTKGKKKKH